MNGCRIGGGILLLLVAMCQSGCKPETSAGSPGGGGERPPTQVVVVEAQRRPVAETLSVVGEIAANEMVEVKAEVDGLVKEVHFQEGKSIEKGDLLVELDQSKLGAQLAEAEANFKLSRISYERNKELFENNLISQQEFDQASSLYEANQATLNLKKRQLADTKIHAPFAGVMGARHVSPGQVISRNSTLTWVVDLDPVKVEFNIPERFLSQVQTGQNLEVRVAAYPDKTFEGEVFFVSPYVEPDTRTALIKARLPNPAQRLKPGMVAYLDLTLTIREDSVVIPEAAISQVLEGGKARIFLVKEDMTVEMRTVEVGQRLSGQAEVMSGLTGGEKVIVEGIQKVGPGAKVTLAPPEAGDPYRS